jgi:periplasmic copper chaperone A
MDIVRRWPAVVVAFSLLFIVAACGAASPGGAGSPTITDAWIRPPMGPDRPAAGYLVITGAPDSADALVSASSPAAMEVEIHETIPGMSGMAGMRPVERIDVAAGAVVQLEPGGYHLMLMGVGSGLAVGQTVEITLTFENAGEIVVQAEVRQG